MNIGQSHPEMMAVCGVDCGTCDIFLVPSIHWSPDCPLLQCCVDEKHLEHCAQCAQFVCQKLEAFATDGQARHREAVERLRRIAKSR
jgi:hypothetical protein